MTTDDLSRPLGTERPRRFPALPSPVKPLIGLAALVVLGLVGWIVLVDDPLGGEPRAVAEIVRRAPANAPAEAPAGAPANQNGAPVGPAPEGMTVTRPGEAPSGDLVIRPVGPGDRDAPNAAGGGPVVIRVPGSPGANAGVAGGGVVREPDPKLIEQVAGLELPRIAGDGTRAMTAYARPTMGMLDPRPKIAILIGGLGIGENVSAEAIAKLPPDVTLGFAPYAADLDRWAARARGDGHEYMLQLPLEPFDYPNNDPGPQTLLTSEPDAVNLERLRWLLGRVRGYVGVAGLSGARFTSSEGSLAPVLTEIGRRGVMFIDDGSSPRSLVVPTAARVGAVAARATAILDARATAADIDAALARLEETARNEGSAIGIGQALPITIERVADWAGRANSRGFVLVPVSAIVNQPPNQAN